MDKRNICLAQYGSVPQSYIDEAFLLNDEICLLPNYGFPTSILETIEKILELEERFGREAWGPQFAIQIKPFAKPKNGISISKDIHRNIVKSIYQIIEPYLSRLNEYYYEYEYEDELGFFEDEESFNDMRNERTKELNKFQFIQWFNDIFLDSEYYGIRQKNTDKNGYTQYEYTPETEACLKQRNQSIESLLKFLIPQLFEKQSDRVLVICYNDGESNENYAFVPYSVIGQTCLLLILVEWIL